MVFYLIAAEEYRYGVMSLIIFLIACTISYFSAFFHPIYNRYIILIILWVSGLAAFAYFTYGLLRVHNKAKSWHLAVAKYLIPSKKRLIVSFLSSLFVELIKNIFFSLIRIKSHFLFNELRPETQVSINYFSYFVFFTEIFFFFFLAVYFILPFVPWLWRKKRKMLFIFSSIIVIVLLIFAIDFNTITDKEYYVSKVYLLFEKGQYDEGLVLCEKVESGFNLIILDRIWSFKPTINCSKLISDFKRNAINRKITDIQNKILNSTTILTSDQIKQYISECEQIATPEFNCEQYLNSSILENKRRFS